MTYLDDRLAELRIHLDHLDEVRRRIASPGDLRRDRSLDNDLRHSLLLVCQRVIDIAGELSTRRRLRFEDYSEAIRNLAIYEELSDSLIRRLEPLPDLRNALVHGNGLVEPAHLMSALDHLDEVERFADTVERMGVRRR